MALSTFAFSFEVEAFSRILEEVSMENGVLFIVIVACSDTYRQLI